VYGVDLDSKYVRFGRDEKGLDIEVGTVEKIAQLERNPDIVIYSHLLEHITDPLVEPAKLRSIIGQNSLLYIAVPEITTLAKRFRSNFTKCITGAHVYYFTRVSLVNLLNKAGYEFVCGDESIHSVFRKSSQTKKYNGYNSDYKYVLSLLRKQESYKTPSLSELYSYFIRFMGKILRAIGLYGIASKIYFKTMGIIRKRY